MIVRMGFCISDIIQYYTISVFIDPEEYLLFKANILIKIGFWIIDFL